PGKSVGISSVLLGLILFGRAAFVFPLSFLSNLLQKSPHVKIDMKQQVTIWWSGLMRGAVSIFTRLGHTTLRENAIMITSTISVVFFSTMYWILYHLLRNLSIILHVMGGYCRTTISQVKFCQSLEPFQSFRHWIFPIIDSLGYPSDADKHLLAWQTGLSRNQ
ncbi:hypothetical protein S83_035415, partial [Arachis hypogaea]